MSAGKRWLAAALLWAAAAAQAQLDNPDAPDLLAAFQARIAPYEQKVSAAAGSDPRAALAEQARFLDAELNQAYEVLMSRLPAEPRSLLKQSQRRWLAYRDAEFALLAQPWTAGPQGSSAVLARGLSRAAVTRQRVELLLAYAQRLPPE